MPIPEFEATRADFDPDRWLAHPNPPKFKPFAVGPRSCVAKASGLLMLRILAWELAASYDVVGASNGKSERCSMLLRLGLDP